MTRDGCDLVSNARSSLFLNGWTKDKNDELSSGVLFVRGSTVYTILSESARARHTVAVKIMVASRRHVEKRLATRALFASRFAGPVRRRTVAGVVLAFAIEVDSIMLTCRVHANGKALVQAAIRTPIASRFVDEARSGSGWKKKRGGIARSRLRDRLEFRTIGKEEKSREPMQVNRAPRRTDRLKKHEQPSQQ